jgi:hypothetical protein
MPPRVCILVLALVLLLVVATGLRGIDFGYHWDEEFCQLAPLRASIEARAPLPGFYMYPSVSYWLNVAGLVPEALGGGGDRSERLLAATRSPGFLLRLRAIHVVLTALAPLWVYLAALSWRRSSAEALLAAAILGLSWECAYHARWVAPDSIMMQLGALTLLFMLRMLIEPGRPAWRRLATLAAALTCGTKYPGGLFLLPILIGVWLNRDRARGLRGLALDLLETAGLFAVAFLVTTPGAVLEAGKFVEDVRLMRDWYGEWGLLGYTITPGFPHLARMAEYLGLVLFSPYGPVACAFSLFALVGAAVVARESGRIAVVLVLFPAAYLLYFSTQRVMVVRNLLVLAPFLALLSARGIAWAVRRLRSPVLGGALAAGVGTMLAANALFLVRAGESIPHREDGRFVAALARHIDERPATQFLVSRKVWDRLAAFDGKTRPNVSLTLSSSTKAVVVYAFEAMRATVEWPANIRRLTEATFGPLEVNFDYYPTWLGSDRILVMPVEEARRARVRVLRKAPLPAQDQR